MVNFVTIYLFVRILVVWHWTPIRTIVISGALSFRKDQNKQKKNDMIRSVEPEGN